MSCVSHNGHRVRDPATNKLKDHEHEADTSDEHEFVERSVTLLQSLLEGLVFLEEAVQENHEGQGEV